MLISHAERQFTPVSHMIIWKLRGHPDAGALRENCRSPLRHGSQGERDGRLALGRPLPFRPKARRASAPAIVQCSRRGPAAIWAGAAAAASTAQRRVRTPVPARWTSGNSRHNSTVADSSSCCRTQRGSRRLPLRFNEHPRSAAAARGIPSQPSSNACTRLDGGVSG